MIFLNARFVAATNVRLPSSALSAPSRMTGRSLAHSEASPCSRAHLTDIVEGTRLPPSADFGIPSLRRHRAVERALLDPKQFAFEDRPRQRSAGERKNGSFTRRRTAVQPRPVITPCRRRLSDMITLKWPRRDRDRRAHTGFASFGSESPGLRLGARTTGGPSTTAARPRRAPQVAAWQALLRAARRRREARSSAY